MLYGNAFVSLGDKKVDLNSDTFKAALLTSSSSPSQDNDDYFNDVTNEASGGGYSAGGVTMTSPTMTWTGATNVFKWDAADVAFTTCPAARYVVIYDSTPGTAATNPLISYINGGADFGGVGGDVTVVFASAGIFTITVS